MSSVSTKCGFNDTPTVSGRDLLEATGPTLFVDIGFDAAYADDGSVPVAGITGIRALVDTGAVESCIDSQLATTLNLPVVDRRMIAGAGGAHEVNVHLAQIYVPALHFIVTGTFVGVHLHAGGQMHQALIGRTFLRHFRMSYEGDTGTVIISTLDPTGKT